MTETDEDLPVLIAGAGPVGISLAASLTRKGHRVELFEAGAALADEARASTFHASTLEMFEQWGVVEPILDYGRRVDQLQFWERETRHCVATYDYGLIAKDTRYPFRLQCPQNKVTRLMLPRVEGRGLGKVNFSSEAVSHRDLGDHVELDVQTPDGTRTHRGSYLIGSDGSASNVRETLGMSLEGFSYEDRFLLVGSNIDYSQVFADMGPVAYIFDPKEWVIIMHLPDVVRTVFRLEPAEDADVAATEENVRMRIHALVGCDIDFDIQMVSHYRVHQRVAPSFRRGRVVLAGDAAHINNPAGGMGMNSGIHDAHLLGENLSRVLRGAPDALLDAYAAARRDAAIHMVQAGSEKNYKDLALADEKARLTRNRAMAEDASHPGRARAYLLRAAMLEERI